MELNKHLKGAKFISRCGCLLIVDCLHMKTKQEQEEVYVASKCLKSRAYSGML